MHEVRTQLIRHAVKRGEGGLAGWLAGCLAFCCYDAFAKDVSERLHLDSRACDKVKGARVKSSIMQTYAKRSYFQLVQCNKHARLS